MCMDRQHVFAACNALLASVNQDPMILEAVLDSMVMIEQTWAASSSVELAAGRDAAHTISTIARQVGSTSIEQLFYQIYSDYCRRLLPFLQGGAF